MYRNPQIGGADMLYGSTRNGHTEKITGSRAVIQGISSDGGLFVPETIPALGIDIEALGNMTYNQIACHILGIYFPEFTKEQLREAVSRAYDGKFGTPVPVPITSVGNTHFLELYHGPTLAFKDMALSLLPELMRLSLDREGIEEEIVILTATSGDTGKAALEGFKNQEGVRVVVFYPQDGVSAMQQLQMTTEDGVNCYVAAVNGNFDTAQSGVKEIFGDRAMAEKLMKQGYRLSSANSINIGRLVPQIVYYVYGYAHLVKTGAVKAGEAINVSVPTGNFGNILAAYYARAMGIPIGRFICASNRNNVLYDFFKTGVYDRNRALVPTSSPSMDILISSNLERLLYEACGRDGGEVDRLMTDLRETGRYTVTDSMRAVMQDFYGAYADENQVFETIESVFDAGMLIDTHTAVGVYALRQYREETGDATPCLVASTASPFKFSHDVGRALGLPVGSLDFYEASQALAKEAGLPVPAQLEKLRTSPVRFEKTYKREEMPQVVADFLGLQ